MADFGEILKELRSTYQPERITQKQLASALNISHNTISAYERGTRIPTLDNLVAFANFFDVSLDYLAGRTKHTAPTVQLSEVYCENITYEDLLVSLSALLPVQRQAITTVLKDMRSMAAIAKTR